MNTDLPKNPKATWFVCTRCNMGYSYAINDDGTCGDLSYLSGQPGQPCNGQLKPVAWAPTFTAFDSGRDYTFWCVSCKRWHSHTREDGLRFAHHSDGQYFIEACRDGRIKKGTIKGLNILEFSKWSESRDKTATESSSYEDANNAPEVSIMPPQRSKVRLFKSGDNMGVQTTAATAEEFWQHFSETLADVIESGRFNHDWEFQLRFWLPQAFEIAAKLRGYKAEVQEERVIYAGAAFVSDDDAVVLSAEGLAADPVAVASA